MPHVSINLIYVGWENFSQDDVATVDAACWATRQVYWQVGFDMFGFSAYSIPVAEAQGYSYIDDNSEADWLTSQWTIPGDGIDVFLVKGFAGQAAGLSPTPGPCDKYQTYPPMTGSVVEVVGAATSNALPHEIGHYLGLDDDYTDPNNVMYYAIDGSNPVAHPVMTPVQGIFIASHCFTRWP
jgi:hypothetical protein